MTEVGLSTKQAIQRLVETGIRDGVSPDRLAPRIMQVVGLRSDQVAAVERFRARLIKEGVNVDAVERRAGAVRGGAAAVSSTSYFPPGNHDSSE